MYSEQQGDKGLTVDTSVLYRQTEQRGNKKSHNRQKQFQDPKSLLD